MKRIQYLFVLIITSIFLTSNVFGNYMTEKQGDKLPAIGEKERIVLVSTEYGDIKIKLYNETPLHRDNFIKLVSESFYDSLTFHRVIDGFMVQGGDPNSKVADKSKTLGDGGPNYKIPAEIRPELFHKKGVIAAAREGDIVNPEKKSSGSQFYLVQGKVYSIQELDVMESRANETKKVGLIRSYIAKPENISVKQKLDSLQKSQDREAINLILKEIEVEIQDDFSKIEKFEYTKEQREAYTTIGGTPHLDGGYTVFGEIIEGLEVVDKIAAVKTGDNNKPIKDIRMTIKVIQ